MADYTYQEGDGVEKLDPTTPNGSIEPVSILDNAIRQIKAFLRDPVKGIIPMIQNAILPVGSVVSFAGLASQLPTGWLECNGQIISRVQFPELFTAIGTVWGVGDGATSFQLPDLRDRFVRGAGLGLFPGSTLSTVGQYTGEVGTKLKASNLPPHGHVNWAASGSDRMWGTGSSDHGYFVNNRAAFPNDETWCRDRNFPIKHSIANGIYANDAACSDRTSTNPQELVQEAITLSPRAGSLLFMIKAT